MKGVSAFTENSDITRLFADINFIYAEVNPILFYSIGNIYSNELLSILPKLSWERSGFSKGERGRFPQNYPYKISSYFYLEFSTTFTQGGDTTP